MKQTKKRKYIGRQSKSREANTPQKSNEEQKNTPGLQSDRCRRRPHRVAVVYPPLEVMRKAVQQTTKETKQNKK